MTCKAERGRLTIVLEGALDGAAAWEVIKRLETCERDTYPVTLDLNGVNDMQWFAASVLTSGLEHIAKAKGAVFLMLLGKPSEPFRSETLSALVSQLKGTQP